MDFLNQIQFGEPVVKRTKQVRPEHDFAVLEVTTQTHNIFRLNTEAASNLNGANRMRYVVDADNRTIVLFYHTNDAEDTGRELSAKNTFRDRDFAGRIGASTAQNETKYYRLEAVRVFNARTPDGRETTTVTLPNDVVAYVVGTEVSAPVSKASVVTEHIQNTLNVNSVV